jgi:hypothetical protein
MVTVDRVKEEIGLLKLFLAALIAIDVSLIAWLAQNYTRANRLLVLAAVATTLMIANDCRCCGMGQPTYVPAHPTVGRLLIYGMGSYNGACCSTHCSGLHDLAIRRG